MADTLNRCFTNCLYCKSLLLHTMCVRYFLEYRTPIALQNYAYQPALDVLIDVGPALRFRRDKKGIMSLIHRVQEKKVPLIFLL